MFNMSYEMLADFKIYMELYILFVIKLDYVPFADTEKYIDIVSLLFKFSFRNTI